MNTLRLKSPAKVNLYLRIINKRPDGYHNIVTFFERIDLCDEIVLRKLKQPGIKIKCSDKDIPADERNLAYKAAGALLDYTGKRLGCQISIKKRIPVGSGLGGGSSNAAAVLLGLNKLWKLRLSQKELLNLGAKIGADVNFFLSGASWALGTGTGSDLRSLAIKRPLWHVLVMPKTGLSSKDIYEYWDNIHNKGKIGPSQPSRKIEAARDEFSSRNSWKIRLTAALADVKILHHSIRNNDLALLAKALHNDLQEPAQVKDKTIHRIKTALKSCGARAVLLSGSGSAVFAVAAYREEVIRIKQALAGLGNNWQVFVVKTY